MTTGRHLVTRLAYFAAKLCLLTLLLVSAPARAAVEQDSLVFDDAPLEDEIINPPWFKLSFLNLREDLDEAVQEGKRGIIVYFGQKHCPYCKKLMDVNFGKSDIVQYTQTHFDFIATDIFGDRQITDFDGSILSEKLYAERQQATFTPTLLFYDKDGKEALRLRGFYPPYQFRAALEFVADGHYRNESFRDYLERADPPPRFEPEDLNPQPFFAPPPFALDRSRLPASRPLAVFFEQGDCHACDILHGGPLASEVIRGQLSMFDAVQLDMWSDTPVLTPSGERLTARAWAQQLGLFYTPTLMFFDERGKEIIRVDSVVNFYRLRGVLDYVLSGAHKRGVSYMRWRQNPMPRNER